MKLTGKRIAVLSEDLYEDLELWYPYYRMTEEGAEVHILGTGKAGYTGKHGIPVTPDKPVDAVSADDYDAVIIPGGYSPDKMRSSSALLDFVRDIYDAEKVVAFICHAGWVPISAGIVKGHSVTSVTSIQHDLENAGARWLDQPVVRDQNLISSRRPGDLPAFCRAIIDVLAENL